MLSVKILLVSLYVVALKCTRRKIKKLPSTFDDYIAVSRAINALQPADPIAIITNVHHRLDCSLLCRNYLPCISTSYIPDEKFCLFSRTALEVRKPLVWDQNSNPLVSHYSELVYQDDFDFRNPKTKLFGHGQPPPICGMNMKGDHFLKNRRKRIIDGWTPEPYQVPWVGSLIKDGKVRCTAFIISRNIADKFSIWVLSAKHCFLSVTMDDEEDKKIDLKLFGVLFGVHDHRIVTQHIVYRTIAAIYLHPDEGIKPKDLALIKLSRPIEFNSYINGLCLTYPEEEITSYDETACATCGFGATEINQKPVVGSNIPQCIEVIVHEPDFDHNLRSDWNSVVKLKAAGFGPYHGDSGSPIFCRADDQWSYLFAVVTGGKIQTLKNAYLTAARISYFIKFIDENTIDYRDLCCSS